jgi:hypothetical protein
MTLLLRFWLSLLLCCASFATVAQSGGSPSPTTDAAATVEFVEGDVRIFDKTKAMRRVNVGDAINEGDSIVTGSDGEIHLHMGDEGLIAVRPNTKMRIAQFRADGDDQDKGIFGLLSGTFRSVTGWIGRYNPRGYLVRTPTATIGVRGTDHEPLVIPPDSTEGDPGTYDKVNAGGTYIQTPQGRVDVPAGRAAFAPQGAKPGMPAPRLLDKVPSFFRPTRNEHRIEGRHEAIQRQLDKRREERRKFVSERKASSGYRREELKPRLQAERKPLAGGRRNEEAAKKQREPVHAQAAQKAKAKAGEREAGRRKPLKQKQQKKQEEKKRQRGERRREE